VVIARREIFDIRTQLMAEDSAGHDNEELIAGIEKGDIKPNFYEGGFKTWECALDLAKLSLDEDILNGFSDGMQDTHIIEVCCHVLSPPKLPSADY
jgi:protein-histidine N-methyltransferase